MSTNPEAPSTIFGRIEGRVVQVQPVFITDIQMPFASMVGFMVKWALAAIPALIILMILFAIFGSMIAGMIGSILHS